MLHTIAVLFPVIRGLILVSLLFLIGIATAWMLFERSIAGKDPQLDARVTLWLLQLPRLFGSFLLVLCIARSVAQLASFMLPGDAFDPDYAQGVLAEGDWGTANVVQAIAAAILFGGTTLAKGSPRIVRTILLVCLPVVIWTQTGMGHGSDEIWPPYVGRLIHSAHLIGGGIWLGALAVLSIAVFPYLYRQKRLQELGKILGSFSKSARLGALLIVTSGLIQTLRYGVSINAFFASTWGKLLTAKLVCFLGVLALGAWNWRRITPAIERELPNSERRLRMAIAAELLLGALMLVATAGLVGSAMPERKKSGVPCEEGSTSCQPTSMKPYPLPSTVHLADLK